MDKNIFYDIVTISCSRLAVVLLQLFYVKLYTTSLADYQLGIYYFLISASYFLNAFLFVPLDSYQQANLYGLLTRNITLNKYIRLNLKMMKPFSRLSLILVAVLFLMNREYAIYAIVCLLLALFLYLTSFTKNILNNLGHKQTVALLQVAEAVVKIVALLFAFRLIESNALNLLTSNILALFIVLYLIVIRLVKLRVFTKKNKQTEPVSLKEVVAFCYPVSISAILNWIQLQGYRLVLVPLGFADMIGIFSAVSSLGGAGMSAVSMIYGQCLMPRIYKTQGRFVKTYISLGLVIVALVAIFTFFTAEFMVPRLTRPDFIVHANLMVYGVLIEAGNFIIGAIGAKLAIEAKTKSILAGSVVSAAFIVIILAVVFKMNAITYHVIGSSLVASQGIMGLYMCYQAYIKRK